MLNEDGTVSYLDCLANKAAMMTVEYFNGDIEVKSDAGAGLQEQFRSGDPITLDTPGWLVAQPSPGAPEWDRVDVTLWDTADARVFGMTYPLEDLVPTGGDSFDRGELKIGEWTWHEFGGGRCLPSTSVRDPAVFVNHPTMMTHDDVLAAISSSQGDLISIAAQLQNGATPDIPIGFQWRVLTDLKASHVPGIALDELIRSVYGTDSRILLAAPLAAHQLGFIWSPSAVPLHAWALRTYPKEFMVGTARVP